MLANHKGRQFELMACNWLRHKGCKLVTRNYHCRFGEIDLIKRDGEHLVFVEVRYRDQPGWGSVLESVDHRKQQRIRLTAGNFLQRNSAMQSLACRFDVLGMYRDRSGSLLHEWVKDAFV
jgi:putative endonuclease